MDDRLTRSGQAPIAFVAVSAFHLLTAVCRRNRAAFWLSACCYAGGIVFGFTLAATSGNSATGSQSGAITSMWQLYSSNARVILLICAGALTLGLVTGLVLLENGTIFSYSLMKAIRRTSVGHSFMVLAPHSLFELAATLLAGTAGFVTFRLVVAKLNHRAAVPVMVSLLDFAVMAISSLLLLLPAAAAEYFVSARFAG